MSTAHYPRPFRKLLRLTNEPPLQYMFAELQHRISSTNLSTHFLSQMCKLHNIIMATRLKSYLQSLEGVFTSSLSVI